MKKYLLKYKEIIDLLSIIPLAAILLPFMFLFEKIALIILCIQVFLLLIQITCFIIKIYISKRY